MLKAMIPRGFSVKKMSKDATSKDAGEQPVRGEDAAVDQPPAQLPLRSALHSSWFGHDMLLGLHEACWQG